MIYLAEKIKEQIKISIERALEELSLGITEVELSHPENMEFGDYATTAAIKLAKTSGDNPKELAEKIAGKILSYKDNYIKNVSAVGGFVNFYLSEKFFKESAEEILKKGDEYGKNENLKGQKVIVEYTDPNPFKAFHIGHLMSNTIGEALARIVEANGAEVKRANYQGDVGMHVAKAVWGAMHKKGDIADGTAYVAGATAFLDEEYKKEITEINKKIYENSDEEINKIYEEGKKRSLENFEEMYEKLGTKFDFYFFENEMAVMGKKIVEENIGKVFKKSEGAVVFCGEKYDAKLHTRVFINSDGIPTYEAKDLGLIKLKSEKYDYDQSVVVTGNEVDEYFKVVLKAMELIYPELRKKTMHISHGMLKLPSGKMSSRTGEVITAEYLIEDVKKAIRENVKKEGFNEELWSKIADKVAVGAIKYSILRQAAGKDIIFDFEKTLSFQGDSGPYLQYTYARMRSVLKKAEEAGVKPVILGDFEENEKKLVKILCRWPEVIERALNDYAPHYIATYLIKVASVFNEYYASNKIISEEKNSAERVAVTLASSQVIKNGLGF